MAKKKVLIITYYWPPAGGPGVQRWLKFAKYLPDYNIHPIVYAPENPTYPIIDKSLQSEIPNEVTLLKLPIKEPYKLAKFLSKKSSKTISRGIISECDRQSFIEKILLFIRGNLFIPDARMAWVKPSVAYLSEYIKNKKIDAIITTGPPHSLHLIGLELKRKFNIKWITDFRDPWTTIGYHKKLKLTKKSQEQHKRLEYEVLNNADTVIVTSEVTKQEFQELTQKPIHVITNGYDHANSASYELDSKFTLSHIGSLLSERNPKILWQVLKELIEDHQDFYKDFQLNLVGVVSENVLDTIKKYNLTNHVNKVGYVSHEEAVKFQKKSQVLLLVEIDSEETSCIIPGKLFEYMISNRPIVALGPKGSDVATILKETHTGRYFFYNDYEDLKSTIFEHYRAFKENRLKIEPFGLQKYSRISLTETLSKLI